MAVDKPVAIGPAQGGFRPRADLAGIRELAQVRGSGEVIPLKLGVVVQDLRELLPGDGAGGTEGAVLVACHHIVGGGPGHGLGVPLAIPDIAEAGVPGNLALQVVQHLHHLGAVYGGVGLKGSFAHTHHNALLVDVGHGVVIPLVLGDVHKGPILGDEGHIHGDAAAGHGEGILAVARCRFHHGVIRGDSGAFAGLDGHRGLLAFAAHLEVNAGDGLGAQVGDGGLHRDRGTHGQGLVIGDRHFRGDGVGVAAGDGNQVGLAVLDGHFCQFS